MPPLLAINTADRNCGPLEGAATGSWSLGSWSNPRVQVAVNYGHMDCGNVREEMVVGNACGGKPGSHGSKVII